LSNIIWPINTENNKLESFSFADEKHENRYRILVTTDGNVKVPYYSGFKEDNNKNIFTVL
jgi:hypothetical protein